MNRSRAADPNSGSAELAELVERLSARLRAGESIDWAEVERQHPTQASEARRLLPTLERLAELSVYSADAPPDEYSAPQTLGDFRIVREVGRGGMGVVYEAEQLSLRRKVALKVLPFAAVMDPRHLQRFKNEALAAASLDHPHVVKVHGVGCDRGVHFIAMQFVDGRSLAELIRDRRGDERPAPAAPAQAPTAPPGGQDPTRSFAPDATDDLPRSKARTGATSRTPADAGYVRRVAEWGVQASEALEHAHGLGVVHRDVKPGNLLVDGRGQLYVADFGLAKMTSDPGVTGTGDLLGTLRYMSPEQAGARHDLVDHRSDVYSLGATLYELLTLTPAFDGGSREEVLSKITSADPAAPRALDRRIPRDLETVVLKAMDKDPTRRYPSAQEFADDLNRFLNSEPVWARRATPLDRAAKWARRHRAAVWSAGVLLVVTAALASGAAVVVWQQKEDKDKALGAKTEALAEREKALGQKDAALRRAAERTRFARAAADTLYTRVFEEWLSDEEGLAPLQRDLLQGALAFYEDLCRDPGAGPDARFEAARAWARVGLIRRATGDPVGAEAALGEAIARVEALAAEDPASAEYPRLQARYLNNLGTLLYRTGRAADAERAWQRGAELAGRSTDPGHQLVLAECRVNLAVLLTEARRYAEAEQAFRPPQEALERLVAERPEDRSARRVLITVYSNRGAALRNAGRPADAESLYRAGIALLARIREERGGFSDTESEFLDGALKKNLALLLLATKREEEAETLLRDSIRVLERLNDIRTRDHRYRDALAGSYTVLADRCAATGRADEAVRLYRSVLLHAEKLALEAPGVVRYHAGLASTCVDLSRLLRKAGQLPEATRVARRGLEVAEQRLAWRATPKDRRRLALQALDYTDLLLDQKPDAPEAADAFALPLEILRGLVAEFPGEAVYRKDLARCHCNLGFALVSGRKWSEAAEQFRLTLEYDPNNPVASKNLQELARVPNGPLPVAPPPRPKGAAPPG